jgi:cell wall-associated NlpC family hydrolase
VISLRARKASLLLLACASALLAAVPAVAGPPSISSKRAEAQQVLDQIQQMDVQLEKAIEAYDLATGKLAQIHQALKTNRFELSVAKQNLHRAQAQLGAQLKALYMNGQDSNSTLAILLGSQNLDDVLNRLDTVNRVSSEQTRVLVEVKQFRRAVQHHGAILRHARAEQVQIVSQRAADKASIEAGLAERQRLLSSIKSEIVKLQQQEAARQAELRREAEARLRQQQLAAEQQLSTAVVGPSAVAPGAPVTSASNGDVVSVAPPPVYGGAVGIAMQYLGTPYVWGGASPGGFDCSGFVMYVFAQMGVSLPHNAAAQYGYGTPVSRDQLEPGDLVFFDGLGHVGIYIGGGQFIHSPHTGDVVKISSLYDSWYAGTYVGARRIT